ncbi:AAEL006630-PA [Aedes aegypti]|uniref:CHK domain-containing protein n=2 Tax=Aedes aegypti TaxID=7159 RepID=A0A903U7M0_AEDAE|nr:uncharacterized protein LOC5568174 isoform X2 [Aedes aegypti]EAT41773.1 AAEL006630-PA [Aedes aegypti]
MVNLADLITADDCREVVRSSLGEGFRVNNYRLEKVKGQPGFLGEYAHLIVTTVQLETEQTQEHSYFVKCLPFTDPKQREIVQEIGIFTKEAVCYRELFSKFEQSPEKVLKWRPDCWLARDDLMVMEDLVDAGFRAMPFQRPFGREHLTLIFERMAQMHACSLDLEYNQMKGKKLGERFGEMLYETTFMRKNPWFEAGLEGILRVALDGSRYSQNSEYRSIIQSQLMDKMDRIYELSEPSGRFQSTQTGEVLYEKPLDCVLFDFQISRYQAPAIDFLCAIYLLTCRSHRDESYDFYVKYYYEQLQQKLSKLHLQAETVLPWEQWLGSLEHYKLFGLVWSGVLHAYVNLPEGYIAQLHESDPKAYHEFGLVSRDAVLMKFFRSDVYYRERLLDSVDETLEYLFGFK